MNEYYREVIKEFIIKNIFSSNYAGDSSIRMYSKSLLVDMDRAIRSIFKDYERELAIDHYDFEISWKYGYIDILISNRFTVNVHIRMDGGANKVLKFEFE